MNRVQIWFLVVAGLLGIGIPFLFIGVQLPSAMHSAILTETAEYSILDEEDKDFWAEIPGRIGLRDKKMYYLFHCNNPEEVAVLGVKPNLTEVGPFTYTYIQDLEGRQYTTEGGVKNSRVSFNKKFVHKYEGKPDDLLKEYRVINLAGLKRWSNIKNKPRFELAIEGFFETFFYARNNLPRDVIIKELISEYHKVDPIYDLTKDLKNVTRQVREALAYDSYYGLLQDQNIYEWSTMCDSSQPRIEHEIMTYFGFSIPNFEIVKQRFCLSYYGKHNKFMDDVCKRIPSCSYYNISFNQWMYGNVIQGKSYHDVTFKNLFGIFEFSNYIKEFFNYINPDYKWQFEKVRWDDKSYHNLLDTYYEYPDFLTDEASVLLYDNMKRLYEAGKQTKNPFKTSGFSPTGKASELDLSRFERIALDLRLSKEQAFMLYSYFEYYVNNTVLLQKQGGNIGKERIANYGAFVYKDISDYYMDFLDVVIYSRILHNRVPDPQKKCESAVRHYFTMNETKSLMDKLVRAICNNKYFNTDLSKPVGWMYFLEASSYPYHYHFARLESYLVYAIPEFTNDTFDAMIFKPQSGFWAQLDNIKAQVKTHYTDKTKKKACENSFSPYCSKRQLFLTQFFQGDITNFPPPEAGLPESPNIAAWWHIIKPYMEYTLAAPKSFGPPIPLPDQPIIVPVEFPFLQKHFGDTRISKSDLYNAFHRIGLYDTDVLYNVLLNIRTPEKLEKFRVFATGFFFNATRYLIRNVQFGPMFDLLMPEESYFGYFNHWLNVEHYLVDYLEGDDCTVNPWIGYNPQSSDMYEKTFDHIRRRTKMNSGTDLKGNIRKYETLYGNENIIFRQLTRDINGDECFFTDKNPFKESIPVNAGTDGFQFGQYPGKSPKGNFMYLIDRDTQRPMKIERKTIDNYRFRRLEVNTYILDFESVYGCDKGVYVANGIDMTSFFQMHSIITRPRFSDINEPGLIIPNIVYTHRLDQDIPPSGARAVDSFYTVEPYSGITLKYEKKMMTSLIIYFDELYDKLPEGGRGEIIPYYSLYEYASASDEFADIMAQHISDYQSTRQTVSVTFTILGTLFVFGGICMIIRACFFEPEEVGIIPNVAVEQAVLSTESKVLEKPETENINPISEPLLMEGEDLQKELLPPADPLPEEEVLT